MKRIVQTVLEDDVDLTGIPAAHRTYWFKCDHCDNLHVVLEDEGGERIASMILDVAMLENMSEAIHLSPSVFKLKERPQ